MGFEDVESIFIDNKEVQSIVVKDSGGILFEKRAAEPLIFTFTGTTLTQYSSGSFSGTNMTIDYGDGTIESTTGKFGHTYSENGTYQVKIYGVRSLGDYCFRDCTGLTSVTIPDGITSFGQHCFRGSGLTSIAIPNSVTSISNNCFYKCANLTSVILPNNISSIANQCFGNCPYLASINIPNNVTSLGSYSFQNCTSLTSINIPDSVSSIVFYCFVNCTGLTFIQLNWTSNDILTYNSNWIPGTSSNLKFHIPAGTTQLYVDKGYPSDKLEEEVIEKIDTQFIEDKSELWLQDINGNGLMNKTIIVQICSNGSIETVTVTSTTDGLTNISTIGNDVKDATFDGDNEYNGCSYTNPHFLCKGTIK